MLNTNDRAPLLAGESPTAATSASVGGRQRRISAEDRDLPVPVDVPQTGDDLRFSFKKLWAFTGPGFLMSIAYLDPGNIEADLQSGAVAQYRLLWVLLFAHILGFFLQRLAARLGIVSGLHLAELSYHFYPRFPRIVLWLMVEIAIIGADMQEVIGTAIAFYLISNGRIPLYGGVIITIFNTFIFLAMDKFGLRKLEFFFGSFIVVMAVMFGYEYVVAAPPQLEVLKGFIPFYGTYTGPMFLQATAVIGSVIMPHNLYLYSALVQTRNVDRGRRSKIVEANMYNFVESAVALTCSFVINLFVMSVFASVMFNTTNADIREVCLARNSSHAADFDGPANDTVPVDIYRGGLILGCEFGSACMYIWAVGIFASGQSSTMAGTYVGQYVMQGFLQLHWPKWVRIFVTRSIALVPSIIVAMQSMKDLTTLNDLLNALQALQLVYALVPLLTFTASERIMHDFRSNRPGKIALTLVCVLVISINMYFLFAYIVSNAPDHWAVYLSLTIALTLYVLFVLYLSFFFVEALLGYRPFSSSALCRKLFPMKESLPIDFPWLEAEPADGADVAAAVSYGSINPSPESRDERPTKQTRLP